MTIQRFADLQPGKPISAGEMNRLHRTVEGLTTITGFGGTQASYDPSGGMTVSPSGAPTIYLKITGSDGGTPPKYSWTLQQDLGNGTFANATPTLTGSASAGIWAQELSGRSVPTDGSFIARGWASLNGLYYWFSSGGTTLLLMKLTGKQYNAGQFTRYSWVPELDSTSPNPITLTDQAGGGTFASNYACNVLFSNQGTPFQGPDIPVPSIVWGQQRTGYVQIMTPPYYDTIRRTGTFDADGEISFISIWDQNTQAWKDGEEVRMVNANA